MTKLTGKEIDTTSYSESLKKLITNQMIISTAKNFNKQIELLCNAVDEIMSDKKIGSGTKANFWIPSLDALSGVELILKERERQIKEFGYNAKHDDGEKDGGLAYAAICYAIPDGPNRESFVADFYPWHIVTYRPTPDDRIKELAKAGALIAAEIDRLQRLKP